MLRIRWSGSVKIGAVPGVEGEDLAIVVPFDRPGDDVDELLTAVFWVRIAGELPPWANNKEGHRFPEHSR